MVDAVTRAKELLSLAKELGFLNLIDVIKMNTDSSAAKSFVNRRGLGKMKHIQSRYLWVQERVAENHLKVTTVPGAENMFACN